MSQMEKLFKLKQNGTTVRTEIVAGLSTFMTMAYIVALNPNLLTGFGANGGQQLWNAVFMATVLSAGIGTLVMAFAANKPFAMAPGMGLNSFFALVVGNIAAMTGIEYTGAYNAALCIILMEGILFLVLSFLRVREKIVEAIPLGVRMGIAPGIGLMLMNIGFGSNAGVYTEDGGPFYMLGTFFTNLTSSITRDTMGKEGYATMVLYVVTTLVGLFAIVAMNHKGIKGSVLYGMLVAAVVYWVGGFIFLDGFAPFASLKDASFVPPFADMMNTTFMKFDFADFFQIGWATAVMLIITFCMIDMFDTIGTLVGTASRAGMLDKDGKMPQMKQALVADAVGTLAGSITGTSTVTTFVESASGVEAGGRTGLTSLTTGVLFLLCMFIAPIAALIPAPATSAALIYVGVLMIGGLKNIDWNDISQVVPVALMLIFMPVTGSIGHGIGIAIISYTAIKLCCGKAKEVTVLTYVLAILFLLKFFLVV